jgi:uncharacterized protein GlcG (DUF336 family)
MHGDTNAKQESESMDISLQQTNTIIAAALRDASARGFKPLTVVVLDRGGHVKGAARQDGAANKRYEIAYGKAHGAISLGMGSRALMNRAETQGYFIDAATAAIGSLIPVPGGVLIHDQDDTLIGAVGVSGDISDNDEISAVAGIEAAGLKAVTG